MPLEWVKKKKKHQPVIKPKFEVATWKGGGLNLRAYFNQVGEPQWLFERVHQHLTGQCEGGVYLRRNIGSLKDTMQAFQVPLTELSYKGVDHVVSEEEPWTDHTLTSRALLVFLFFAAKHKRNSAEGKVAAFHFSSSWLLHCWKHLAMNHHLLLAFAYLMRIGVCRGWRFALHHKV